jgi:hypothetical protein
MFSFQEPLLPTPPQLEEDSKAMQVEIEIMKTVFKTTFKSINNISTSKVETIEKVESKIQKNSKRLQSLESPSKFLTIPSTKAFELVLMKPLIDPICKSRYFNMKVALKSLTEAKMPMIEKLDLEVMVFNKTGGLITRNMSGNEILRGNFLHSLSFFVMEIAHIAYFRIQITEVSSHFEGKVVNLKVKAKKNEFLEKSGLKVKSLWIKNLVVKAKDLRKKGMLSEDRI